MIKKLPLSLFNISMLLASIIQAATLQPPRRTSISYSTFAKILSSELDQQPYDEAEISYMSEMEFSWNETTSQSKSKDIWDDDVEMNLPFLLCTEEQHDGVDRAQFIRATLNSTEHQPIALEPVYNRAEMSCFITYAAHSQVADLTENSSFGSEGELSLSLSSGIAVSPLTSYMKMRKGTMSSIERMSANDFEGKQLAVGLCPATSGSSEDAENLGSVILNRIEEMDERRGMRTSLSNFAWTHPDFEFYPNLHQKRSSVHQDRALFWRGVVDEGLSADHGCATMLSDVEVEANGHNGVLFHLGTGFASDESSASSSSCVLSLVAALSTQAEVCSIESVPHAATLNTVATWIVQSGKEDYTPWYDKNITGKGQVVLVSDTGLDTDNCYFWDSSPGELRNSTTQLDRRKVVNYVDFKDDTDYLLGHGTHVAGTVAGKKSSDGIAEDGDGFGEGIAKDAKLAFFDMGLGTTCCYVPSANKIFNAAYTDAKARIHNGSWGIGDNNYHSVAAKFDAYVYENDDFLLIHSAGNNGVSDEEGSIGAPATGKNMITVGASQSAGRDIYNGMKGTDYLAHFSSRGPTFDDRIKPEVVAPGFSILSGAAIPDVVGECDPENEPNRYTDLDGYGLKFTQGTSMSAPVVAGVAALIRQYFEEGYYPSGVKNEGNSNTDPSAALIKAVLINGAQNLLGIEGDDGVVYPINEYDNHQGFGRINLMSSLPIAGNDIGVEIFDRQLLTPGGASEFKFVTRSHSCESTNDFSATLVWTDIAGTIGCQNCLLNNLDLSVQQDSFGNTTHPNGGLEPDTVNNSERVRISNVGPGESFTVRVYAANLATAEQKYSLVVSGCGIGDRTSTLAPVTSESSTPAPSPMPVVAATTSSPISAAWENDMLEKINTERTNAGVPTVCFNDKLTAAAEMHTNDMIDNDFFGHTGSDGSSVGSRATIEGYSWNGIAENIAQGQGSVSAVIEAWMDSSAHRGNILNASFNHVGVAMIDNVWTQVLAMNTNGDEVCTDSTALPTQSPVTDAPTLTPIVAATDMPTAAPTTSAPIMSPATSEPTLSPVAAATGAPIQSPVAVTAAPTATALDLLSLETTFQHNNGESGNMFDIVAKTNIVVRSMAIHVKSTGSEIVELYTLQGTHDGVETNAGEWSSMGAATIVSQGAGIPTEVPIDSLTPIPVSNGVRQAFYVTVQSTKMRYTDGTSIENIYTSNDDLDLYEGVAIAYSFGLPIGGARIWNGILYYTKGDIFTPDVTPGPVASPVAVSITVAPTADPDRSSNCYLLLQGRDCVLAYGCTWSTGSCQTKVVV